MHLKVIDNALDFISRAATELWDTTLTDTQQLKYSTIHLYEGIELLLKARLMQEHWSLILLKPDDYKANTFEQGDFVSVTYKLARTRLESFCSVKFDKKAHDAFDSLRKLRNRYVHFVCHENRTRVMAQQLKAWHYALDILERKTILLSLEQKEELAKVKFLIMRSEEFLNVRFDEVGPELKQAKEEGLIVATCPTCEKLSLIIGDGLCCKVCVVDDLYPTDVADDYATMNNVFWKHPKHGVDDEVVYCGLCGEQACVPTGEDIEENVERALDSLPREPSDDLGSSSYLCFACGNIEFTPYPDKCGYCGTLYFADRSKDGELSGCPNCWGF